MTQVILIVIQECLFSRVIRLRMSTLIAKHFLKVSISMIWKKCVGQSTSQVKWNLNSPSLSKVEKLKKSLQNEKVKRLFERLIVWLSENNITTLLIELLDRLLIRYFLILVESIFILCHALYSNFSNLVEWKYEPKQDYHFGRNPKGSWKCKSQNGSYTQTHFGI